MRHYTDHLGQQLNAAAETEAHRTSLGRLARSVSVIPRPVSGLTVAAALVAVIAVSVASSAGNHADKAVAFPILAKPPIDASSHRNRLHLLVQAGADLRRVRAFETPRGQGYVTKVGDELCIAVPDVDGMAGGCQPVKAARAHGIVVALIGSDQGAGNSEFVAVLPHGAPPPIVRHADGRRASVPMSDGVASATFSDDVEVDVTINGHTRTTQVPLRPPTDGEGTVYDCGHGHVATGPSRAAACGHQ